MEAAAPRTRRRRRGGRAFLHSAGRAYVCDERLLRGRHRDPAFTSNFQNPRARKDSEAKEDRTRRRCLHGRRRRVWCRCAWCRWCCWAGGCRFFPPFPPFPPSPFRPFLPAAVFATVSAAGNETLGNWSNGPVDQMPMMIILHHKKSQPPPQHHQHAHVVHHPCSCHSTLLGTRYATRAAATRTRFRTR